MATAPSKTATVADHPPKPNVASLRAAYELLVYGIDSVNSLADLHRRSTAAKGAGAPTHEVQDLLRAMLVMAGATLDATLKKVVNDALPQAVSRSEDARKTAEDHINKQVLRVLDSQGGSRLATALLSDSPREVLTGYIIDDLTGGSLQSYEEVRRVASYLGIADYKPPAGLKEALHARNQIIHEMDMLPPDSKSIRKRRPRKRADMCRLAKVLLDVASDFLHHTDGILKGS